MSVVLAVHASKCPHSPPMYYVISNDIGTNFATSNLHLLVDVYDTLLNSQLAFVQQN